MIVFTEVEVDGFSDPALGLLVVDYIHDELRIRPVTGFVDPEEAAGFPAVLEYYDGSPVFFCAVRVALDRDDLHTFDGQEAREFEVVSF